MYNWLSLSNPVWSSEHLLVFLSSGSSGIFGRQLVNMHAFSRYVSFFQGDSGEFVRFLTERRDSNALVKGFCWEHGRWKYAGSGTDGRLGGVTCDSFQKWPCRITIVKRDGLVRKPRFNVLSQETWFLVVKCQSFERSCEKLGEVISSKDPV